MPASAYALLSVFVALSVATGVAAARLVGGWRPWSPILPTLAAFGALWVVGHRLVVRIGPTLELFGVRVSLALDLAVGLAAALAAAVIQRAAISLFQAQEGRAGRDRLA